MTKKTADNRWDPIPLTPTIRRTERDFFQIPVDDLVERGLYAAKTTIDLRECNHLTKDLLVSHGFSPEKKETAVLNFPTNSGKSTLFYDLIMHYADLDDTIVIVCSPFIKLVEKDFAEINERMGSNVVRYDDRTELFVGQGYVTIKPQVQRFKVHVMTVNCLLQNHGGLAGDTSEEKQEYLTTLLQYATDEKKKVILFIDEIHESVHNFHVEYLPHLAKWRDRLHKVFVASATFTVSSYVVLQHLARFTNNTITVFESPRNRDLPGRASLTIHLVKKQYREKKLEPLECLHRILDGWLTKGNTGPINIVTGLNNLARQLNSKTNPLSLAARFKDLNFKLLVADEINTEFVPGGNHLGTLFKTGVNIEEPNNLLVIILPYTFDTIKPTEKINYGIFTDGVPSLVQALGRQRKGGECHVIMALPSSTIGGTALTVGSSTIPLFDKVSETYKPQPGQFRELVNEYKNKIEGLAEHIKFLQGSADGAEGIGSYYPSIQDYLLEKSKDRIVRESLSGGRGLSAYLLWAACNDQFEGVKLTSVRYWKPKEEVIELSNDSAKNWESICELFPNLVPPNATLPDAYSTVYQTLFVNSHEYQLRFKIGEKKHDAKNAAKKPRVLKTVLGCVFHALGDAVFPDMSRKTDETTYYTFYLHRLLAAQQHNLPESMRTTVGELNEWRNDFMRFLLEHSVVTRRTNQRVIEMETEAYWLPASRQRLTDLLAMLEAVDPVLKTGAVKPSNRDKGKPFKIAMLVAVSEIKRGQKRKSGESARVDRWVLPDSANLSQR